MNELEQAKQLMAMAYEGLSWNKKKIEKKIGFMIEALYGKPKWTIKDLEPNELTHFIGHMEGRVSRRQEQLKRKESLTPQPPA